MFCGCCVDVVRMLCGCCVDVLNCVQCRTQLEMAPWKAPCLCLVSRPSVSRISVRSQQMPKKQENPRWPQWEPMRIISLKGFLYRANVCIKYYKRISPYICLILPSFSLLLEVWKRNFCLAAPPGAPVRLQTAPCSLQQHKHPDPKAHTKHLTTRLLKIIEDSTSDFWLCWSQAKRRLRRSLA